MRSAGHFAGAALVALALAAPAHAEPIEVGATPVPLERGDPGRTAVGRLAFLAGFALTSPHASWGGFSGMSMNSPRLLSRSASVSPSKN